MTVIKINEKVQKKNSTTVLKPTKISRRTIIQTRKISVCKIKQVLTGIELPGLVTSSISVTVKSRKLILKKTYTTGTNSSSIDIRHWDRGGGGDPYRDHWV